MSPDNKRQTLLELQKQLTQLEELNRNTLEQSESLKQAQRALDLYQTRIREEAESMIKERRETLQTTLNKEVKTAERKLERARKRRKHERDRQMKQLIADSIAQRQDQIEEIKSQVKALVKSEKLPGYCGNPSWYRLFMPSRFTDYLILLLTALILGLGLPTLIYYVIPNHQPWHFFILLPIFILMTVYPYLHICQKWRDTHKDVLLTIRDKFHTIETIRQEIDDISNNITNSADDSAYSLKKQDDKLSTARDRMEQARENQTSRLQQFEQHTRSDIIKEFQEKSQQKEDELKAVIHRLTRERSLNMEMAAELQLKIVDEYENLFGAENLNLDWVSRSLKELDKTQLQVQKNTASENNL